MSSDKKELNLPKTNFPMQANLTSLESKMIENKCWVSTSENINSYILHDGPPYANGNIHIGHAYNKTLKDITARYLNFKDNFNATHYVCGWDCHGLPIELAVKNDYSKKNLEFNPLDLEIYRNYAKEQLENQKKQFERLGIFVNHKYETMSSNFENEELKAFQSLVKKGFVFSRNKPVHWCWSCETSLAESELEYKKVEDNSVYVLFPSVREPTLSLLVWTTTPWTLKGNKAIAANKDIQYVVAALPGTEKNVIVSEWFAKNELKLERLFYQKLETEKFINSEFLDPFGEDKNPRKIFHADYVLEETGTGLVHIAPSCGKEDYLYFVKTFGNEKVIVESYADTKGRINGIFYKKANKFFVEELKAKSLLWKEEKKEHDYPHCWRCHNPTIQRATKQVFLNYESKKDFIAKEAQKINFFPAKSKNRFLSFINSRTEWCLSRQRFWGVPIPEYYCSDCNEYNFDLDVTVEDWRNEKYIPKCNLCNKENTIKSKDILDVWFDSGLTYKTLPNKVSDFVIEGSDQHRGWFQSSHILSCLLENQTCFKNIVSHGFVLDAAGRKMSKSLGNVVDPLKVAKEKGVEIFRLWAISQQIGEDVNFDDKTLEVQKSNYRKIRNTLRYLHANLYDFNKRNNCEINPDKNEMERLERFKNNFISSFESVEYHKFLQNLMKYLDELSTGYMETSKLALYESKFDSKERREIQKTYFIILETLIPIIEILLPFTISELKEYKEKERTNATIP